MHNIGVSQISVLDKYVAIVGKDYFVEATYRNDENVLNMGLIYD